MLALFLALPGQLPPAADGARSATAQRQVSPEGVWFTNETIDNLLGRWADQAVERYELDTGQAEKLQKVLRSRWSAFLRKDHAMPLFDAVQREWMMTQQDMRKFLTPAQQVRLNADATETAARLRSLRTTLETPPQSPSGLRDTGHATDEPAYSAAKQRVDEELLRWDHFVAEFILRYQLGTAQREAAHSVLRECKARAREHFNRNPVRMERLETLLRVNAEAGDDRRSEVVAMYGPFDDIFAELRGRVEAIPTTAQAATATDE